MYLSTARKAELAEGRLLTTAADLAAFLLFEARYEPIGECLSAALQLGVDSFTCGRAGRYEDDLLIIGALTATAHELRRRWPDSARMVQVSVAVEGFMAEYFSTNVAPHHHVKLEQNGDMEPHG